MGDNPIDKVTPLAKPSNIMVFITSIIALAIGAFISVIVQRWLHEQDWGKKSIVGWSTSTDYNFDFTYGDFAGIVLGVLLIIFGSKMHKILKYVGYGWVSYLVAFEFREMAGWL